MTDACACIYVYYTCHACVDLHAYMHTYIHIIQTIHTIHVKHIIHTYIHAYIHALKIKKTEATTRRVANEAELLHAMMGLLGDGALLSGFRCLFWG